MAALALVVAVDVTVKAPGLYVMSLEDYLADPAPEPSLNASLAHVLLSQSPMHAHLAHPKLNPALARETGEHFDLGTVVHGLVLESDDRICEVPAKDWRTKAARQVREAARKAGQIPLLTAQAQAARAMAEAIDFQVEQFPEPMPLRNGLAERVLVWREGPIWCRARLDYLHLDFKAAEDLKTTSESAEPAAWSRNLFERGHDLQAAFHSRGVQVICGELPEFRFLVAEIAPPYALSLIGLDPMALDFANQRMRAAIDLWGQCRRTDRWPGYPTRPVYAEVPPWIRGRWEERRFLRETP